MEYRLGDIDRPFPTRTGRAQLIHFLVVLYNEHNECLERSGLVGLVLRIEQLFLETTFHLNKRVASQQFMVTCLYDRRPSSSL